MSKPDSQHQAPVDRQVCSHVPVQQRSRLILRWEFDTRRFEVLARSATRASLLGQRTRATSCVKLRAATTKTDHVNQVEHRSTAGRHN